MSHHHWHGGRWSSGSRFWGAVHRLERVGGLRRCDEDQFVKTAGNRRGGRRNSLRHSARVVGDAASPKHRRTRHTRRPHRDGRQRYRRPKIERRISANAPSSGPALSSARSTTNFTPERVENVSAVLAVLDKGHKRQRTPPAARVASGSGPVRTPSPFQTTRPKLAGLA